MLDALFKPASVAIIGASTKELSIGNRIIKNLQDFGYQGPIYPINPKADEVRGIKAYGNICDVPGEIDLAHIVIPNKYVPFAIDDCGKKNVKTVIINTAGFKEIGGKGAELEELVVNKAREHGIRVFGPNCQGIINTDPGIRAYCNFTFTKPEAGGISIVAQSGGVGEVINQRFSELGVGIRMYASNGNACDISIPEILQYWGRDDETRVIVLYVESIADPSKFMEVAREVAAKKPVLGMKAGRTEEGAKAASSHTGGLARMEITTELMFKKTGIIIFRDEEELCQAAAAFATQPIPRGKSVGMITNTGGPAIIATDELIEAGLKIPKLSVRAKAILTDQLYSAASINNPIDVLATANAGHFRAAMDVLMEEETIDSLYINFVTPFFVDNESIAHEIVEVNLLGKKPIVCNLMTDKRQWVGTLRILKEGNVPCYAFPETAARALVALTRYGEIRAREVGEVHIFEDVDMSLALEIIRSKKESGYISQADVNGLLDSYGIPVAPWSLVDNADEAMKAAEKIGYPVVVKVDSEEIVHKSDVGGVAVNIKEESTLRLTLNEMSDKFSSLRYKFFIQKFLSSGKEVIVGAKKEEGLGHLIMAGTGGVLVELLKDASFGIAPLTGAEAAEMLASLKLYPILSGFRGQAGVDIGKLIEIIQRVSMMVTELPSIVEMDLNPIFAFEEGRQPIVVDARIKI
ncbi:MAG: acetate--CoA ligase family protein [Candidatus Thermoplasmatota archaeon]|jgi:acetyltransferase|nr:acetate--CoA ligase family protein [Candidatus Thermoplasmatota archaeon]